MKIAISATGSNLDSLLDVRFGRCTYFQIHDSETGDFVVIENQGQMSGGGAGIVASQQLIDEKIDVIITGNLGPNAFEVIEKAQVKAYKSEEISIEKVLENFNNGNLERISISGPADHGGH